MRILDRIGRLGDFEAIALGGLPARATLANTDDDIETAVLEVQRMGTALTAITEHCDARALEGFLIDVFLRVQMHLE